MFIESPKKYAVSHYLIRIVGTLNIFSLILSIYSREYYRALTDLGFRSVLLNWYWISSLVLPLIVGIEAWFLRSRQNKELAWDIVIALVWFFLWWSIVFYAITHPAWL